MVPLKISEIFILKHAVYDGGQDFQGLKHFLETQGIKEAVMGLMSLIGKV